MRYQDNSNGSEFLSPIPYTWYIMYVWLSTSKLCYNALYTKKYKISFSKMAAATMLSQKYMQTFKFM
jgi:hypothetical protein